MGVDDGGVSASDADGDGGGTPKAEEFGCFVTGEGCVGERGGEEVDGRFEWGSHEE